MFARGVGAISCKGFKFLADRKLWREAARAIVSMDAIHPVAQQRFINAWCRVSFSRYLPADDLFFALLRKIFPPYEGGDEALFRGQRVGDEPGVSWTVAPHIALKFAWFGEENIAPIALALDGPDKPTRDHAVILSAIVPASAIISAPCLRTTLEGEYIIDPRGLVFGSEPANEAAGWIRDHVMVGLGACAQLSYQISAIGERHGMIEDEPLRDLMARAADCGDEEAQELLSSGILETLASVKALAPVGLPP
jgi:hypothetical protein